MTTLSVPASFLDRHAPAKEEVLITKEKHGVGLLAAAHLVYADTPSRLFFDIITHMINVGVLHYRDVLRLSRVQRTWSTLNKNCTVWAALAKAYQLKVMFVCPDLFLGGIVFATAIKQRRKTILDACAAVLAYHPTKTKLVGEIAWLIVDDRPEEARHIDVVTSDADLLASDLVHSRLYRFHKPHEATWWAIESPAVPTVYRSLACGDYRLDMNSAATFIKFDHLKKKAINTKAALNALCVAARRYYGSESLIEYQQERGRIGGIARAYRQAIDLGIKLPRVMEFIIKMDDQWQASRAIPSNPPAAKRNSDDLDVPLPKRTAISRPVEDDDSESDGDNDLLERVCDIDKALHTTGDDLADIVMRSM